MTFKFTTSIDLNNKERKALWKVFTIGQSYTSSKFTIFHQLENRGFICLKKGSTCFDLTDLGKDLVATMVSSYFGEIQRDGKKKYHCSWFTTGKFQMMWVDEHNDPHVLSLDNKEEARSLKDALLQYLFFVDSDEANNP